ncbi:MAG: MBL fold metallo-hydrolase [Burkholderiales bacterium]|nr:MBL fold metallo-hydrolase [Burkholderiales bacterium]
MRSFSMISTMYRLIAALSLALGLVVAHAGAPMVKTQAPGYYRMMLGDFEITVLNDGTVGLPMTKLLTNIAPGKAEADLARSFLKDPVETSVNAYLVNTGAKLVLIDTGAGVFFGPTLGKLQASLKAAGYSAEQVDEVYITHMHGDHVGGLLAGDKAAFPNAVVRVDKRDAEFWLSQAQMDKAPEEAKGFFKAAMAATAPYVAAGNFKPFDGNTELVPGVSSIATYGHTPGHSIYAVESKGQKLVLWGDLMHAAAVQFATPMVTIQFDTDSAKATEQRAKAYADATSQGHWVGSAHLSFPGLGRLRGEGSGYVYVPVNYRAVP